MPFTLVPALEVQRRLYDQPRDLNRFRAYLDELTGGGDELQIQLSTFNPMAREHAAEAVDRLIALDAESLAGAAIEDANARLAEVPDLPTWRVTVVVSDDLGGMWTHRPTAEFDRATHPGYRDWLAATYWTSDHPTEDSVTTEVLRTCYRAAHLQRLGPPTTLAALLRQEALAARFAGATAAPLEPTEATRIAAAIDPLRDRTDRPALLTALYGDEAGASLGYAALGLEAGEALALEAIRLGDLDPVAALTDGNNQRR